MIALSLDLETRDPDLKKLGCGAARDGEVICICARLYDSELDVYRNYVDIDVNIARDLVSQADLIVGSNIQYDLEYLDKKLNIEVPDSAAIVDVLTMERLIDTVSFRVNLETLSQKYLGLSKLSKELEDYATAKGIKKYMENLHLMPRDLVAKYCFYDCKLALDVWMHQKRILEETCKEAAEIEIDIQRVIYEMKQEGVPFDSAFSKALEGEMKVDLQLKKMQLEESLGTSKFKTAEGKKIIAKYCDNAGINYRLTAKKAEPQFNAEFYTRNANDDQLKLIAEYQEVDKLQREFVTKIRGMAVDDVIYPGINAMKGEEGGAITGRFSMSKPNMQQVSGRNALWSGKIRSQFKAPEDYTWVKMDYSQQEMRLLFEFASRDGGIDAKRMVDMYKQDYTLDCYNLTADLCKDKGLTISRDLAKKLMLATLYCMGPNKLSGQLGCGEEEAKELLTKFRDVLPFLRRFQRGVISVVEDRASTGTAYIETLAGRRVCVPVIEQEIKDSSGAIRGRRMMADGAYKAINYLIQGSAADILKKAMRSLYLELSIIPTLVVHDEINVLLHKDIVTETIPKLVYIMENTYPLDVPMLVDVEIGTAWGDVIEYAETRNTVLQK